MKQQQIVYNLEEFAAKYQLCDIFGAYAAHLSISGCTHTETATGEDDFRSMVRERTLFTKILLVKEGEVEMTVADKTVALDSSEPKLLAGKSLLVVSAKQVASIHRISPNFEAECILVDEPFSSESTLYQLSDDKQKSVLDIFHFIRSIVCHQHINKVEMIQSMFNVLRLIIEELPYEQCAITHDLGHKKEIYEIFLHHLYRNFRTERQIRFYADKMNVSMAYLSRIVKEMSGSTINEHVASLLYKEICNLLKQSDMTIGEIADTLHFNDQSALTNFFKQRAGMTPVAYRKL